MATPAHKVEHGYDGSAVRLRNERLIAIGEMTAEFAHQVRTPLASVMLYADQIDTADDHQARVAAKIIDGLTDLKRMVSDMLGFAAGIRVADDEVNVRQLLCGVRDQVRGQLAPGSRLRVSADDPKLILRANKEAIKGALLNLVTNADQAKPAGSDILLHGYRCGEDIHFCVADDGPGIANDIKPRLFEAFFTTRPQGTGLGLSVVQAVAAAHGGDVSVTSSDLGSVFTLQIPARPIQIFAKQGTAR